MSAATFRTINDKPIFWQENGRIHVCEGAEVHKGVTLIWTLCQRDVPANSAFTTSEDVKPTCKCCVERATEKSLPSDRIRAAVLAFEPDEASVRERFAMAAGALQCAAKLLPDGEGHVVHFNGRWSHLGSRSIREILNLANQALEG